MRTTLKHLETCILSLNKITGNPIKANNSTPIATGPFKGGTTYTANVGNYHLCAGCGNFNLAQMANTNGGIRTILYGNSKKELRTAIITLMQGIYIGQAND